MHHCVDGEENYFDGDIEMFVVEYFYWESLVIFVPALVF